jgi:hypothetical protein
MYPNFIDLLAIDHGPLVANPRQSEACHPDRADDQRHSELLFPRSGPIKQNFSNVIDMLVMLAVKNIDLMVPFLSSPFETVPMSPRGLTLRSMQL